MSGGYFDRAFGNWLPDDEKFYCDKCGEEVAEDDLTEVNGDFLCENCLSEYNECEICNSLTHTDELIELANGKMVCPSCYDEHYVENG